MPICIARNWSVSFADSKFEWKIGADLVQKIGGDECVKVHAYDYGFCRLVCEGFLDPVPNFKKISLAQTEGYKSLVRMRNERQIEELQKQEASKASSLFGPASSREPPQKVQRRSFTVLDMLRKNPELISITLPTIDGFIGKEVSVQRPSHPCDSLVLKLDEAVLEHVVAYIREKGIDTDLVTNKRQYARGPAKGIWPIIGDRYLVRVPSDGGTEHSKVFHSESAAVRAREGCTLEPETICDAPTED